MPYHLVDIREGFKPQKDWAVFLDRDGVIVEERHLVHKLKDFKMIPVAAAAIRKLNRAKVPVFVVHNAAVAARGLCNEDQVVRLNLKMKEELYKVGAYVDGILFCPHHKEAYNPLYVFDCDWRKPGVGMLNFAKKTFGLNLKKSFIMGDSFRDVELGQNSGSQVLLLKTGHAGKDGDIKAYKFLEFENILDAVEFIIKKRK